jgi:hypothetical protein
MITVMSVLLGIDMEAFDNRRDASATAPTASFDTPPESPQSPPASTSTSKPAPDVKMAEPEDEEPDEEAQAKAAALKEKDFGNAAYKKREFPQAAAHFTKAWDLWPKDMTFLTNLAGAFLLALSFRV